MENNAFILDEAVAAEHRRWLAAFDSQHLRNWEKVLANDPEAAMCEASLRLLLAENGNEVMPNEDLTGGRQTPDYLCRQNGGSFYVEVTCLGIGKVTEATKLSHLPSDEFEWYGPLNEAVFNACVKKTPQCRDVLHPTLLAVGTFHGQASCLCVEKHHLRDLLTGTRLITRSIDTRTGYPVGDSYEATRLERAAFVRPDSPKDMAFARLPVSGVLVCGIGVVPPRVYGLLHPSPVRPFDRALLPRIEFGRLKMDCQSGTMSTEWEGGASP